MLVVLACAGVFIGKTIQEHQEKERIKDGLREWAQEYNDKRIWCIQHQDDATC